MAHANNRLPRTTRERHHQVVVLAWVAWVGQPGVGLPPFKYVTGISATSSNAWSTVPVPPGA